MPEKWGEGLWGEGLWGLAANPLAFDELTLYYVNLLIAQYVNKAKARNTVGVFCREVSADSIAAAVRDGFNLETAVGKQLETLAAYRGCVRTIYGIDLSRDYFAMPYYDDTVPAGYTGYAFYDDTDEEAGAGYWLQYADLDRPLYAMTDDELRRLTMFVALTQSRLLSVKEIDDILWEFFGANLVMTDNEDMSVTYTHDPADPDTLFKIIYGSGNLPKIAAVLNIVV